MRSVTFVTRFAGITAVMCLLAQPLFAYAKTPDDAKYDEQWYLGAIDAETAWETTTGSRKIVVAVLDTGVDVDHPDLEDNLWVNDDELADNDVDDDGNGFVDDVYGWDFVQDDNNPSAQPYGSDAAISHGTVIAGIIGASGNNGIGVSGVLWDVQIMPVRMLNGSGSGTSAAAAQAVDYAVENGADVINLSFAGENADRVLRESIHRAYTAGVVVVAAMGNEATDTDDVAVYPACLRDGDSDWVIGVASSTITDGASDFSNYGSTCTDLAAPGEDIYGVMYYDKRGGFPDAYMGGWSGTSMASPIVAGSVALLLAAYPDLTVDEVRNALKLSVDPLVLARGLRGKYGSGRLNVARALTVAAQYADAAPAVADEDAEEDVAEDAAIVTPVGTNDVVVVTAASAGQSPLVSVHDAAGNVTLDFMAYGEGFRGGVHVAMGDVNGDGVADIVTGAGSGGGPHVRVFTTQGALLGEFFPYATTSRAGVEVATGDVDGDGVDEVLTVVGSGVSREVVASSYKGVEVLRFTASAFSTSAALRVAAGDIDGDGKDEIVVATGKGTAPTVAVYDDSGTYLLEFAPYAATFLGGVYVAMGDVNGDGADEMVTGTGDGGGPHVRVFNRIGAVTHSFFAFDSASRHGVRVAAADMDGDGIAEIVAAPGPGMSDVRIFSASGVVTTSWTATRTGTEGTGIAAW